jgi:hypothetical protein
VSCVRFERAVQKPEVGVHVSDTHLIILNINLYKVRQHFSRIILSHVCASSESK